MKKILLNIDEDMLEKIKYISKKENSNVSKYIREVLKKEIFEYSNVDVCCDKMNEVKKLINSLKSRNPNKGDLK